jgi:hypothetical protein
MFGSEDQSFLPFDAMLYRKQSKGLPTGIAIVRDDTALGLWNVISFIIFLLILFL